jgi:cell division septum initiation protein DivIVA
MTEADVRKRENRRFAVINEVAKALDEISMLEHEARRDAEMIIAEAEAKAAQIVADALNNAKTMTDEVKAHLAALEDIARNKAPYDGNDLKITGHQQFDASELQCREDIPKCGIDYGTLCPEEAAPE